MPIYEYECDKCGHVFEAIQKVDARPLRQCELETCRGKVQRLVSSPAIQFKGTGWYVTDYARKGKAGSDSEGSKSSEGEKTEKGSTKKSTTAKKESSSTSSKADSKTKSS